MIYWVYSLVMIIHLADIKQLCTLKCIILKGHDIVAPPCKWDSLLFRRLSSFSLSHNKSLSSEPPGAEKTSAAAVQMHSSWLLQVNLLITALKMKGCGCQLGQQYFTLCTLISLFLVNSAWAGHRVESVEAYKLWIWFLCTVGTLSVLTFIFVSDTFCVAVSSCGCEGWLLWTLLLWNFAN